MTHSSADIVERLREFAAYGGDAKARILAQLALTEIERLRGGAARTPVSYDDLRNAYSDYMVKNYDLRHSHSPTAIFAKAMLEHFDIRRKGGDVAQPSREAREKEITRLATIEECARVADLSADNADIWATQQMASGIATCIRALAIPSTQSATEECSCVGAVIGSHDSSCPFSRPDGAGK